VKRLRPSPAVCMALLALFVSLGGTTYAVTSLPRDSVGTRQLRDRSVTEDKLSGSAVITPKMATGAVTNRKIRRGTITGSRIAANALGGAQIDESMLAPVALALDAERAKVATRALTADTVEHVGRVDRAFSADTAAVADRAKVADTATVAESLRAVDASAALLTLADEDLTAEVTVGCGPGSAVVGGGFRQLDESGDIPLVSTSGPASCADWKVEVVDLIIDDGQPIQGVVFALCIRAGGA
jgi:hypothetical protein